MSEEAVLHAGHGTVLVRLGDLVTEKSASGLEVARSTRARTGVVAAHSRPFEVGDTVWFAGSTEVLHIEGDVYAVAKEAIAAYRRPVPPPAGQYA